MTNRNQQQEERFAKAAHIIESQKLDDMAAMRVVDDIVGKPDFKSLVAEKMMCVCGQEKPVTQFPIRNTGVMDVVYNVCPACTKEAAKLSHLCCANCKTTVGHLIPGREPSGFTFVADRFYHMAFCPQCSNKEKGKADIVEKVIFFTKNGIPMLTAPDFEYTNSPDDETKN